MRTLAKLTTADPTCTTRWLVWAVATAWALTAASKTNLAQAIVPAAPAKLSPTVKHAYARLVELAKSLPRHGYVFSKLQIIPAEHVTTQDAEQLLRLLQHTRRFGTDIVVDVYLRWQLLEAIADAKDFVPDRDVLLRLYYSAPPYRIFRLPSPDSAKLRAAISKRDSSRSALNRAKSTLLVDDAIKYDWQQASRSLRQHLVSRTIAYVRQQRKANPNLYTEYTYADTLPWTKCNRTQRKELFELGRRVFKPLTASQRRAAEAKVSAAQKAFEIAKTDLAMLQSRLGKRYNPKFGKWLAYNQAINAYRRLCLELIVSHARDIAGELLIREIYRCNQRADPFIFQIFDLLQRICTRVAAAARKASQQPKVADVRDWRLVESVMKKLFVVINRDKGKLREYVKIPDMAASSPDQSSVITLDFRKSSLSTITRVLRERYDKAFQAVAGNPHWQQLLKK